MEIYTIVIIAILAVIIIRLWKNGNSWKNKFEELSVSNNNEQTALKEKIAALQAKLEASENSCAKIVEQLNRQHEENRKASELQYERNIAEMEKQWELKLQTLRQEFENLSERHLKEQQEKLKASNRENVEMLLAPLKETIHGFSEEFKHNKEQQVANKASIETIIKSLMERTELIGKNAAELTRALKADPKKQGNWGEAVLKNILESSGMEEGREFTTQQQETDEEGRRLIPDVVVHLPEGRNVIIDSKVSLTAYTNYMTTDEPSERERLLKEHLNSVRKHVKELASKDYQKVVRNSAGYVLMFIPNEGSYILAMENDARLATDAYREHIIILNPTNLMMALQLVYHLWQSERQSKNVESIYNSASKLYDKFVGFSENFMKIGTSIDALQKLYATAGGQLTTGRGNIVRQLEQWKKKGMTSTKNIPHQLLQDDVPDDEIPDAETTD